MQTSCNYPENYFAKNNKKRPKSDITETLTIYTVPKQKRNMRKLYARD
jgi:hypothetical protein